MDMQPDVKANSVPSWLILLLAAACGLIAANLYYAQTVIGPIGVTTGLSSAAAGLIVTLTQIGYVIGLLFIVPLSDILENKRLVTFFLIILVVALIAAAFSSHAVLFLTASLVIGISSVVAQILVPYATYLTSEEQRGRVVGNVMSGLLLGIMLARPVASFITSLLGWQAVFVFSAIVIGLLTLLLSRALPARQPQPAMKYGQLILSLGSLLKTFPMLRRRALYQASLFGAFSLFWTTVPLQLANEYGMSQQGIAWFALAGVGGAIAAPIAGRWADKGLTRILTGLAMVIAVASFGLAYLFQGHSTATLILLVVVAITLDMAVSGNLVLGQRIIYSLSEARGRVNGIFMSIFFVGGAIGSSLGSWSYAHGGWSLTTLIGLLMPLLALVYYLTEKKVTVVSNP
ncbi:MFS transporter [Paenibacillus taichungensis]|jgi:predicted MFS family arabinose efflux permease|uniref:MFS transporter n=1 Tax=Paenibacillus taichungensis TaxID=484184 RepID=A0ABX2MML2_9BACL|nr:MULTISPECIES: MFS transporter [Paenibacillus]OME79907.1 MFS transporter [Paenibacillus pabuli]MEC0105784.1 MFS transporter [Paenibacillus taichungensis]MEC0198338.1 MFS transporter [Paenibacillus taichungensis]NUU55274.1 MFS transporter [Paenibacillus taichungensis]PIH56465.1 MFS transporter [Paenibacillus sp. LK1]